MMDSDVAQSGLWALKMLNEGTTPPIFTGIPSHVGSIEAHIIALLLLILPPKPVIYVLPTFISYLVFFWIFYYFVRSILGIGTALITAILLIFPSEAIQFHWIYANSNTTLWLLFGTIAIYVTKILIEKKSENNEYWGLLGFICGFCFWIRELSIATSLICIIYIFRSKATKELKKLILFAIMFLIGSMPVFLYNFQNDWESTNFLFNNFKDKQNVMLNLSSILKKIDIFIDSNLNYLFELKHFNNLLSVNSNFLDKLLVCSFALVLFLYLIFNSRSIKEFFCNFEVHSLSSEIFLLVLIMTGLQVLFIPVYKTYTPPAVLRYYYPGNIFIFPIIGNILYIIYRRSKIISILLISILIIIHIPSLKTVYDYQKKRYVDLNYFKNFIEEHKVSTIYSDFWFNELANLITKGKYNFKNNVGPSLVRGNITFNSNSNGTENIIVAIRGGRNYVKELFQLTRTQYKSINLKTLDIYYDYSKGFMKYFDHCEPVLIFCQYLFEYSKPLNFNIECKKGDKISLDAVFIKERLYRDVKMQINILTPKGKIIKIPETPLNLDFLKIHPGINIYKYPKILELEFNDLDPFYDGPGIYKIIPVLLNAKTNKIFNKPVITTIHVE